MINFEEELSKFSPSKEVEQAEQVPQTIFNSVDEDIIADYGNTDFYRMINGKKAADVWAVMNELMDTLQVINPKLYDGVMRQLL